MVKQHGMSKTPEYKAWSFMKYRCLCTSFPQYKDYGGRGITVCKRWNNSFMEFYNDVGPRPSNKHSIDRINNDGNYEPSNVKWSTKLEQNRNKREYSVGKLNTSGYKNVSFINGQWRVSVTIDDRDFYIGYYRSKDDANVAALTFHKILNNFNLSWKQDKR
jgi:hypothetical protein